MKSLLIAALLFCSISSFAQQHVLTPPHDTTTATKPKDGVGPVVRNYTLKQKTGFWAWLFNTPPDTFNMCYTYPIVHDTIIGAITSIPVIEGKDGLMEMTATSIEDKIKIFKVLGIKYARIHLNASDPTTYVYKQYEDAGIKLIPTIVFEKTSESNRKFSTNIEGLKSGLIRLFDMLKAQAHLPEAIAFENEPLNPVYWDTSKNNPITRYFNQLNAVCEIAHKYGVKVMDGGITYNSNKAFQPKYTAYVEMLSTTSADYANLHWYFGDWKKPIEMFSQQTTYIRNITKKPVVSHEYGMLTNDVSVLKQGKELMKDFPYRFRYNGTGNENRVVYPQYVNGRIMQ